MQPYRPTFRMNCTFVDNLIGPPTPPVSSHLAVGFAGFEPGAAIPEPRKEDSLEAHCRRQNRVYVDPFGGVFAGVAGRAVAVLFLALAGAEKAIER